MAVSVTLVVDDVISRLRGISSLNQDAIFYVYSDKEFLDRSELHSYPKVGVWYEGLSPHPKDPSQFGVSAVLTINIFVLGAPAEFATVLEDKNTITQTLDEIRASLKLTASPTGHGWKFISEAPYPVDEDNNFVYIQRWQTNTILV